MERAPSVDYSWLTVALGGLIVFIGGQGLIHLFSGKGGSESDLEQGGGALGQALASLLSDLVSPVGAFVILVGIVLVGILLLFNITLVAFVTPFANGARAAWQMASEGVASTQQALRERRQARAQQAAALPVARATGRSRRSLADEPAPELPAPTPSPAPVSQTVWTGGSKTRAASASAPTSVAASAADGASAAGAGVGTVGVAVGAAAAGAAIGADAPLEKPALKDYQSDKDKAHPESDRGGAHAHPPEAVEAARGDAARPRHRDR